MGFAVDDRKIDPSELHGNIRGFQVVFQESFQIDNVASDKPPR
jgi:hypothetical protein